MLVRFTNGEVVRYERGGFLIYKPDAMAWEVCTGDPRQANSGAEVLASLFAPNVAAVEMSDNCGVSVTFGGKASVIQRH